MPKTGTVYKVVRVSKRGFLYSAIVRGRNIRLRYKPGEVTHSPNGMRPLAFGNREAAKRFCWLHLLRGGEVWEAEATDVRPEYRVASDWGYLRVIRRFWANLADPEAAGVHTGYAPEGCVSCQTIKLVRKVV